jgi:hypothetical protein
LRIRKHDGTGLGAVHSRLPGALSADDIAVRVEFLGVLAEIANVSSLVLCVPIECVLGKYAVDIKDVVDNSRAHALNGDVLNFL